VLGVGRDGEGYLVGTHVSYADIGTHAHGVQCPIGPTLISPRLQRLAHERQRRCEYECAASAQLLDQPERSQRLARTAGSHELRSFRSPPRTAWQWP
jgi:class 3 adenylate cyclase